MQQKHIEKHMTAKQLRFRLNFGSAQQRRLAHQCLDQIKIIDELRLILEIKKEWQNVTE